VTFEQLVDAGLRNDGETVVALRKHLGRVEGSLHRDGSVTVDDKRYRSLSGAAKAVSGTTSEPGWEFWGVRRDGNVVALYDVRAEYLAAMGLPSAAGN
jgi:hypothetical protein